MLLLLIFFLSDGASFPSFLAPFLSAPFFESLPPFFCAFAAYSSSIFFFCSSSNSASLASNYSLCFFINYSSFSYGLWKRGESIASLENNVQFLYIFFILMGYSSRRSIYVPPRKDLSSWTLSSAIYTFSSPLYSLVVTFGSSFQISILRPLSSFPIIYMQALTS